METLLSNSNENSTKFFVNGHNAANKVMLDAEIKSTASSPSRSFTEQRGDGSSNPNPEKVDEKLTKDKADKKQLGLEQRRNQCRRRGVTPLIPNRRYVDHMNMTFDKSQLTSLEVANLKLYHQSTMGGPFPIKLQILLKMAEELEFNHIISWLPHGRAFMIHRPLLFEKKIMIELLNQSKLSSFKRQLNLYDFKRITHGADSGAYYNEMFLRRKPILATKMVRRKIKGEIRISTYVHKEPDFYSMPFMGPIFDTPSHQGSVRQFDQGALPTGFKGKGMRCSDEDSWWGVKERPMPSIMMVEGGGHLDRGARQSASLFSDIQSGTRMVTSSFNDIASSKQFDYPLSRPRLPLVPQQSLVDGNIVLQMRSQHSHQKDVDPQSFKRLASSQQQPHSSMMFVPGATTNSSFNQEFNIMKNRTSPPALSAAHEMYPFSNWYADNPSAHQKQI